MQGRAPSVQTYVKFRDFQFWSNVFVRFGRVVSPLNLPSLLMVRRSFKLCQWIFTYWSLKVEKKLWKDLLRIKKSSEDACCSNNQVAEIEFRKTLIHPDLKPEREVNIACLQLSLLKGK